MPIFRRRTTEHAVLAWRADRDAVLTALAQEDVPAAVGSSEHGWTLVRVLVNGREVVEPRCRDLVDLLDDLARTLRAPGATAAGGGPGPTVVEAVAPGRTPVAALIPASDAPDAPSREHWREVLGALERLDSLEAVLAAAAPVGPQTRGSKTAGALRDRRSVAVAQAAGLPAGLLDHDLVEGDGAVREVVLARCSAPDVDVVASALGLPLRRVVVDGTTVVVGKDAEATVMLPVAAGLGSGRRAALLLWRQGGTRGYQLLRSGDVLDVHVWDRSYELVLPSTDIDEELRDDLRQALSPAEGDAALLLQHLATGDDASRPDVVAVRSLLRRPPGPDVLADLCRVLGLPPAAAQVVEGEVVEGEVVEGEVVEGRAVRGSGADVLAGAVDVEPRSSVRAVYEAATAVREDDPWIMRVGREKPWWWRLSDLVWVVVATVWALDLWPGGTAAKVGAVVLLVTAVLCLWDAVTPAHRGTAEELPEPDGPAAS